MPVVPIDEDDLSRRGRAAVAAALPGATLAPVTRLQGGSSSVTYRAAIGYQPTRVYKPAQPGAASGPREVVLKVAPAGVAPVKNRDVLRQARLQQALQGTGVPCPLVVATDAGAPPEVPPFYVMAFEEGDCIEPNVLPEDKSLPAGEVRARELDAARILGLLHALDPAARGLGDEPEVTPQDELDKWAKSLATCDEDIRAGHEEVLERLAAAVPPGDRSSLIHGDYRLGNTLSAGNRVVSVIDWEIWARSDPRVDLAWFLMMGNPDPELGRRVTAGMPPAAELIDVYQRACGTEVKDLHWFEALVRYKQAAISALIIRNARRRGDKPPFAPPAHMFRSARKLLA